MTTGQIRSDLTAALPGLPSQLADEMAEAVGTGGHLPGSLVARCEETVGLEVGAVLRGLLGIATRRALVPVSGYHVGAAVQVRPRGQERCGAIYLGANLEFTGVALHHTLHAEQAAVNHAWLCDEIGIGLIATSAAPCGHCRQFLWEVDREVLLLDARSSKQGSETRPLRELLPDAFGPEDLEIERRLMAPMVDRVDPERRSDDPVEGAAYRAATASYAPYSGNSAGAAIELADGGIWAGRYAENAAFNPTVLPLTSALSLARMRGWDPASCPILRAILVVGDPAPHADGARAVLSATGSAIELEVVLAELG